MLVKEFQETLVNSLNTNFENIVIIEISTNLSEHTSIYFDYNNKKVLVGGSKTDRIFLNQILYYQSIFRVGTFSLDEDNSKEEIIQKLKETILKDEIFLDYFEEKSHNLKSDFLYDKLTTQTKLSPLVKLLIEAILHDKKTSTMFWNSFDVKNRIEYLFSKNSTKNEVINYIREVCWESLLNYHKEDINRSLQNGCLIRITSYVDIYKHLLCLTYFSETVKETELYKEVLELFKQYALKILIIQKGKDKIKVSFSESDFEELLSYIKSSGSMGFEEFWQLLSETVGERLELEVTETVEE